MNEDRRRHSVRADGAADLPVARDNAPPEVWLSWPRDFRGIGERLDWLRERPKRGAGDGEGEGVAARAVVPSAPAAAPAPDPQGAEPPEQGG